MALHIGLIGCGLWGRNILRDLRQLGAEVTVVDPSPTAHAAARDHDAAAVSSAADLGSVDGIVVATPASTHAAVIEAVLDRGVPIFTEKPFTLDLASARELSQLAPDRLFVMHVWRYHPGVERMRDLVGTAGFGPPLWLRTVRANWTSPRRDVDSIWTMLPHDVSIVREILGYVPEPIAAVAEPAAAGPTGVIAVLGREPRVVIETSTRYADKRREVRVHCRDAVMVLTGTATDTVHVHRLDPADPAEVIGEVERVSPQPALERELDTFLRHLRGGPRPKSGMADALAITTATLEVRRLAGIDGD